jgi:hypothetical protein
VSELETKLPHPLCDLTAFLFSEMSPACFRIAFDGIGEVWFTAPVVKKAFDVV